MILPLTQKHKKSAFSMWAYKGVNNIWHTVMHCAPHKWFGAKENFFWPSQQTWDQFHCKQNSKFSIFVTPFWLSYKPIRPTLKTSTTLFPLEYYKKKKIKLICFSFCVSNYFKLFNSKYALNSLQPFTNIFCLIIIAIIYKIYIGRYFNFLWCDHPKRVCWADCYKTVVQNCIIFLLHFFVFFFKLPTFLELHSNFVGLCSKV